jgi:hypothetical protein
MGSDDFVISEIEKFLIYYNLKHALRWRKDNTQKDEIKSVTEHVYRMYILIDYFLPFYPHLDSVKVSQIAT